MKYITFLIVLLTSQNALSAVIWDWKINNPNVTVSPSENVVFYATLFNGETSETLSELDVNLPEEVVDLNFIVVTLDTNLLDEYTYDIGEQGSGTIRSQFAGVVLEPGESHQFILYTLVPTDGTATLGSYTMDINSLQLTASSQGFLDFGGTNVTVVPIPSASILFLSGLIPLLSREKLTSKDTGLATTTRFACRCFGR